jgi:uncharacterized Zn finger protein
MDRTEKIAQLCSVSWEELEDWAGTTIAKRGQAYHRDGRVHDLAYTDDGALLAWVQGTARYATLVDYDDSGLSSECSCPYGDTCKHAVALVLAHRAAAAQRRELPTAPDDDQRLLLLGAAADEWDEDDWDEDDQIDDGAPAATVPGGRAAGQLHAFLEGLTKEQLVDLLVDLAQRFPEAQSALEARRTLATGSVAQLVRDTRRMIASVSADLGWRNEWDGAGFTPDYSEIRDRLELLLRQGYADQVVALGEELLDAGLRQVEQSHDEGETAMEVASCLTIVFQALGQSSVATAEQLLQAIDMELRDSYDLCAGSVAFWEQERAAADWSIVADALIERLARLPAVSREDFTNSYRRERLSDWAIRALDQAERSAEVIPLCEREAEQNGSYVRLVQRLVTAGRRAKAEQWIAKGIAALDATKPGLSGQLRTIQRELWEQAGDWPQVAALRAEEFFRSPSMSTLMVLRGAAERAEVWPAVRAAALRYLETGERPIAAERVVGGQTIRPWPLPATDLPEPTRGWRPQFPLLNVLIELAADEGRLDEVVRWYDQQRVDVGGWRTINHDLVAEAIADDYPDRAITIWKQLAEAQIEQTSPPAYQGAAGYLRKLGRLLERQGRADEWRRYLNNLREANKRKRRLLEILDGL